MNYECNICNFFSKNKTDMTRHYNTAKHKTKLKNNKYCMECDKTFDTIVQYTRHLYYHLEKNKKTDKEIDNIIGNNIDKDIVIKKNNINEGIGKKIVNKKKNLNKKKDNKTSKDLINFLSINNDIKDSITTIEYHKFIYILKNKLFHEKNDINFKNCEFEKKLLEYYNENIFIKTISNIILDLINHNNLSQQIIYISDITRKTFIVRFRNKWIYDINGILILKYIINPLLNCIRKIIVNYRTKIIDKIDISKYDDNAKLLHIHNYSNLIYFENDLKDKFDSKILNYLAPYLKYKTQDEIDENIVIDNQINNCIDKITEEFLHITEII